MRNVINIKNFLPRIFCLEDIQCSPGEGGGFHYCAILYHDMACVTVTFNRTERFHDLKRGDMVSVRWMPSMQSDHGAIKIAGLIFQNHSASIKNQKYLNPFLIVPHAPSVDRRLINCARDLWDISTKEVRRQLTVRVFSADRTFEVAVQPNVE